MILGKVSVGKRADIYITIDFVKLKAVNNLLNYRFFLKHTKKNKVV